MRDYTIEVARELEAMGLEVKVKDVEKANGVMLSGIEINTGTNVRPMIYTDGFEERGCDTKEAAKKIAESYEREYKKTASGIDVEFFGDYEKVKGMLTVRLYNESTTAEVYRSAKRYGFDDLIIVPVVNVELPDGETGSIKVLKQHIEKWGVDKNTVFKDAMENTKKNNVKIESMTSFMSNIIGWDDEDVNARLDGILIVSNEKKVFGASAILGALKGLKKATVNGFFVIPSSVHEVLVVPKMPGMTKEDVDSMVVQVNETAVAPEEVLGDHSYAF